MPVPRTIFAFNGDLESRLALHWLVHERGYQVLTLSINLGQEVYLEPLGELALELGATAAQVIDGREAFLRDFALPVLQADAVYQTSCFLGSALARYLIARELVRTAHEEGCNSVAHSAASKGNDQVRMETAIAAQDPRLAGLLPLVRELNRVGGEHGVGRSDVVEDRLFGIKSREFYEAPTPTILLAAHRDLESIVHSRELIQVREWLARRYAELVYSGLWFHD